MNLESLPIEAYAMPQITFFEVFRMLRLRDRLEQGRLSHSLPDMRQEGASPAGEGGFQGGFQGAELRDQGVCYQGSPVQGQELRLTNLSSKALDQQRLGHYSTQRYNHIRNEIYFKSSFMN